MNSSNEISPSDSILERIRERESLLMDTPMSPPTDDADINETQYGENEYVQALRELLPEVYLGCDGADPDLVTVDCNPVEVSFQFFIKFSILTFCFSFCFCVFLLRMVVSRQIR